MEKNLTEQYARWRREAVADPDLQAELAAMEGDAAKIEDAFYRNVCAVIRGEAEPIVTHNQQRRLVKLIETIFESAEKNEVIKLSL